jgi:hypothetical protein
VICYRSPRAARIAKGKLGRREGLAVAMARILASFSHRGQTATLSLIPSLGA